MVFNNQVVLVTLLIATIVWTSILTVFVWRMIAHYNRLTLGVSKTGLHDILDTIVANEEGLKKQVRNLEAALARVGADGSFHIQRVGIVRFNPFSDTGGAQSFTVAFLDGHDNGIVMTSLYARTGNRWYIKEIRSGKGRDIELSREEQTAIKKATPIEKKLKYE